MMMPARGAIAVLALAILLPSFLPETALAASCREELDRFERRLNDSSLAAVAPDRYAELARAAEDAAELRDEELCMERVAELNAALTEAAGTPPAPGGTRAPNPAAPPARPAPPAAPLLLDAGPVDYADDTSAGREQADAEHRRRPGQPPIPGDA